MKKLLIGFLVGIGIALVITVYAGHEFFTDVPEGEWYTEAVHVLADIGLVSGYSDGTFRPSNDVNRAEIAVMLKNMLVRMGHPTAVCIADPLQRSDIGSIEYPYPVSFYYQRTPWLGAIFTADDCGEERLKKFFGGRKGKYTLGSELTLKYTPSEELVNILQMIGYKCDEDIGDVQCEKWKLDKEVEIQKLLQIKRYSDFFKRDDCINCG